MHTAHLSVELIQDAAPGLDQALLPHQNSDHERDLHLWQWELLMSLCHQFAIIQRNFHELQNHCLYPSETNRKLLFVWAINGFIRIIVKESLYQIYLFTKKLHRPLSWEIHYEGLGSSELRNFNSWTKFERKPSRSSLRTLASKVLDARHYTLNKFLLILMLLCQRFHYLWECTNKRFNYLWECINTFKCFLLTFRIIVSSEFHIYFFTQFLKPSNKL